MKQHEDKTEWKTPTMEQPLFNPLTDEEAAVIRGGKIAAGTCVGIGYACNSKGGFRLGVCVIVGGIRQPKD